MSRVRMTRTKGYTLPEVMVAFVLLGIGLTGVCPLVIMQSKMSTRIGQGLDPAAGNFGAGQTFALYPASDPWARKLGVAASFQSQDAPPPVMVKRSMLPNAYVVSIVAPITKSSDGLSVTIQVSTMATQP